MIGRCFATLFILMAVTMLACSDEGTKSKNSPPERPHDPVPADGAAAQAAYLTLMWQCLDPENDILFFDVLIDTVNPPVRKLPQLREVREVEVAVSQGRQYFWRVLALDSAGNSDISPVWGFRTGTFTDGWSTGAPLQTARIGAMGAAVGGKIFVFGGIGFEGYLGSSEEYNSSTASWRYVASLPTARAYGAAVTLGRRIYVIGGTPAGSLVDRYDPDTDTWEPAAPLPTPRSRFAADTANGRIYVFGGYENDLPILEFDPSADHWQAVASLTSPRNGFSATTLAGKIYLIGGSSATQPWLDRCDRFDPVTHGMGPRAAIPSFRRDHRAVTLDDLIYVTGGFNAITVHRFFASLEVYDPVTDTWRTKSSMTSPRHDHVAVALDGLIYCIGGLTDAAPDILNSVEVYNPVQDP